ncbi:hypothetical protein PG995_006602 [Apiospora arundinis]
MTRWGLWVVPSFPLAPRVRTGVGLLEMVDYGRVKMMAVPHGFTKIPIRFGGNDATLAASYLTEKGK